jgi:hypothetical protein
VRAASGNVDNARFAVMMGGPPGASQSRTTAADKSMLSNYLEGPTLSAAQSLAAGTVPAQILVPAGTVTAVQGGN